MAATAGFQGKIFGFALLVAAPGSVRQIVNGVPQPWIAGEPSGDGAAFSRAPGDGGNKAAFAVSFEQKVKDKTSEKPAPAQK